MGAIEEALDSLSWVMRTMAGPVLRKTTAPPLRMQFFWDGAQLKQEVVASDGARVRDIKLGEKALGGRDNKGKPVEASWDWTESGLQLSQNHALEAINLFMCERFIFISESK